ncbi:MAG TPA: type II secretion system F family protein [Candidatus Xenobia bacterium]|jgi:type IV pilus assembly protein PilC
MPNLQDRVLGISGKAQALFFRQLATMVQAGMTFLGALETLCNASPGGIQRWLSEAIPKLREGAPFSAAFTDYPYLFTPFIGAMVVSAEQSGRVDQVLLSLADHVERAWQARMELMTRLAYPFLMLHAGIVIPPLVTWYMKGLGAYLAVVIPGFLILYGTLLGGILLYRTTVLKEIRTLVDAMLLFTPVVGRLARLMAAMWFIRTLAELMDAGLAVPKALELAAGACGNSIMEQRLLTAIPKVQNGRSLTEAFTDIDALPYTVVQMLASAEQSGTIPHMLRKSSDLMEIDVRAGLQTVGVAIPMVVFFIIAGAMGYQIITLYKQVYAPIMNL